MTRRMQPENAPLPREEGPFNPHLPIGHVPIAGQITYSLDPEWIGLKAFRRDESERPYGMTWQLAGELHAAGFSAKNKVFYWKRNGNTDEPKPCS